MKAHTKETQATMTPNKALQYLKEGNQRFQNNLKANRNLLEQVNDTSEGQFPLAGTKLIVVLGHTSCGAIKGACDHARLGNLTALINKIEPAVDAVTEPTDENLRNSKNLEFVDNVAAKNVLLTIGNIRKKSPVLTEMEDNGEIKVVGAMYDVSNGEVVFYD